MNCAGEEVGVGETGCYWWGEAEELLQWFEEILETVCFAVGEAFDDCSGEGAARQQVLFDACGLFLKPASDVSGCHECVDEAESFSPYENGIKSRDLPVLICQKRNIELQPLVLPQNLPAHFARMCHVAQYR